IEWLVIEIEQVSKPSNLAVEARIGQKKKITRRCARRVRCAAASRAVTTETPHKRESGGGRIPEESFGALRSPVLFGFSYCWFVTRGRPCRVAGSLLRPGLFQNTPCYYD